MATTSKSKPKKTNKSSDTKKTKATSSRSSSKATASKKPVSKTTASNTAALKSAASKSTSKKKPVKQTTKTAKKTTKKSVKKSKEKAATTKQADSKTTAIQSEVSQAEVATPTPPIYATTPHSSYSFESFILWVNNQFSILLLVGIFAILGFFVGSIQTENRMLKGGNVGSRPTVVDSIAPADPVAAGDLANMPEITSDDFIRGAKNPEIYLVEYSDFECTFCARFHPTMQQVLEEYGDEVAWVYRHYPLGFHPLAQPTAEASECIADRYGPDAFWQYNDALFSLTEAGSLSEESMYQAAADLGYNRSQLQDCVESGEMAARVQEDFEGGTAAGVSGTPATILVTTDGEYEMVSGAVSFDELSTFLEAYL